MPVVSAVAIDCVDPVALGRFWQHLLGGELRYRDDGDTELHGGPVQIDFARVPQAKGDPKNRLQLDLKVDPAVRREAVDRAISFGATTADDIYDGGRWQVLRDPEGNEFCIVWGAQVTL